MTPLPLDAARQRPECPDYPFAGHLVYQGLTIDIETPCGGTRSGVSPEGVAWHCTVAAHYGEVRGTKAIDGDAVDAFVGPDPHAPFAWVVQAKRPGTQQFDEPKCMLGFATQAEALGAFRASYSAPGFVLAVVKWPMPALVHALKSPELQAGRLGQRALWQTLRKGGPLQILMHLAKRPSSTDLEAQGQTRLDFIKVPASTRKGKPVKAYVRVGKVAVEHGAPAPAAAAPVPAPASAKPTHREPDPHPPNDYFDELEHSFPSEAGIDGPFAARRLREAMNAHGVPDFAAKLVETKARKLRWEVRAGQNPYTIAAAQVRTALDPENLTIGTPGDTLYGHHVGTVAEVRDQIDEWEDFHRGNEEEHMGVFFTEPEHRGLFFYTTPDDTRTILGHHGINRTAKTVAAMGEYAGQWTAAFRTMIVTHNHPSGGTLSGEDLAFAAVLDLAEIRATSPDGHAWVLRRPATGWPNRVDIDVATAAAQTEAVQRATSLVEEQWSEHEDRVREFPALLRREWAAGLDRHLDPIGLRIERVAERPRRAEAAHPGRDWTPVRAERSAIPGLGGSELRKGVGRRLAGDRWVTSADAARRVLEPLVGPIQIDHVVVDDGNQVRAEVEIRRRANLEVLAKAVWTDATDGVTGALWQLPAHARIRVRGEAWSLDGRTTPNHVRLRPPTGDHLDLEHTLVAERADSPLRRRELAARQALEVATLQALARF